MAHDDVDDAVVERVHDAVLGGMGLLVLHSAHYSKVFRRLLGTSCSLRWRNDGERELVWTVDPAHPIAAGVPHPIVIDAQEMYGEHFDIPRARRARLRQLVRGRRGVPRRLLLPARRRADLLLQPGRPGVPDLPPPRRPAGARQRGRWAAPRARGDAPEAPTRRSAGSRELRTSTAAPLRGVVAGAGELGPYWARSCSAARTPSSPAGSTWTRSCVRARPRPSCGSRDAARPATRSSAMLDRRAAGLPRQRDRAGRAPRGDDRGARARGPRAEREAAGRDAGRGAGDGRGRRRAPAAAHGQPEPALHAGAASPSARRVARLGPLSSSPATSTARTATRRPVPVQLRAAAAAGHGDPPVRRAPARSPAPTR